MGLILKLLALVLFFSFYGSGVQASPSEPVTLVIYTDLSGSMDSVTSTGVSKIGAVKEASGEIIKSLAQYCGKIDVAVSNISYLAHGNRRIGGELIHPTEEAPFLTEEDEDFDAKLGQRLIMAYRASTEDTNSPQFNSNAAEYSYNSFAFTLGEHVKKASRYPNKGLVAGLLISDALPLIESSGPVEALAKTQLAIEERPSLFGVLGSKRGHCEDPYVPGGTGVTKNYVKDPEGHEKFAELSGGYFWEICDTNEIKFSMREFIMMITEKASCLQLS